MAKLNPLSVKEAMGRLKVSRPTFYNLVASGKLRTYKVNSRRFTTDEYIDEFIEKSASKAAGR